MAGPDTLEVTSGNIEDLKSAPAAVIDFTATWCGPCQTIAPTFAALCARHPECLFVKVDVDEMQEAAEASAVVAMPTFQVFWKGESVSTVSGAETAKLQALVLRASGLAKKP